MLLRGASAVYGAAAAWRRQWYARNPARRRRLHRPVISVGNLSLGGRGKTPVVAAIAKLLQGAGERPAILSRGYARRRRPEGVTVVSDGTRVLVDVETAGDEPLMLARSLPGVCVLVADDRYSAGALAESTFGATVHVLDDGFQHVALARDVDLLLVDDHDLGDHVVPAGRLREPVDALRLADAVLAPESSTVSERMRGIAPRVPFFGVRRHLGAPIWIARESRPAPDEHSPCFAVAAIARPGRFFSDLRAGGWNVSGTMSFPDHHWFTGADITAIAHAARAAGAEAIITTDKDAVRLEGHPCELPMARVPLAVSIEPPSFAEWLLERVRASRGGSEARARSL